jgi:hypothetical protein
MCAFRHRFLAGSLAALSVALFVGLGEGQPTPKGKEKPPGKKAPNREEPGTGGFNLFSATATGRPGQGQRLPVDAGQLLHLANQCLRRRLRAGDPQAAEQIGQLVPVGHGESYG